MFDYSMCNVMMVKQLINCIHITKYRKAKNEEAKLARPKCICFVMGISTVS